MMGLKMNRKWQRFFMLGVLIIFAGVASGCAAGAYGYHEDDYYEDDYRVTTAFYYELAPYGEWVFVRPYGFVWRPYVSYHWRPFFYGHWVWSHYGWTWVSYEPFGWIVYHYGYWNYHPRIGWYWIPGYEWSPARVTWISFGTYVGWAPLPPPGVHWPEPWYYGRHRRRSHVHINVWITVPIHEMTREYVGHYHRDTLPYRPHPGHSYSVQHRAPDVYEVERLARVHVPRLRVEEHTIRLGGKRVKRIELPEYEQRKIERYRYEVERKVLKPRHKERWRDDGERRYDRRERNLHNKRVKPKYKEKDEE